ncbi:unnamed protein product [Closterium sp. NIES-64]|nr:unnamed protein product [Closterium sp. NIES-64]
MRMPVLRICVILFVSLLAVVKSAFPRICLPPHLPRLSCATRIKEQPSLLRLFRRARHRASHTSETSSRLRRKERVRGSEGRSCSRNVEGGRGSAAYPSRLVWFFVDLREHLSALHSALLHKQAAFVAAAVTQAAFVAAAVIQILSLYRFSCASTPTPPPPVLLVGHSMAGIVALAHRRLTGGGDVNEGGDGKDTWRGRGRTRRQLILSSPATVLPVSTPARPSSVLLVGHSMGGIVTLPPGPQETHRGRRRERGIWAALETTTRPPFVWAAGGAFNGASCASTPAHPPSVLLPLPLPLQPSMHALYHSLIQHTPNSPSSALLLASLAAGRSDWQEAETCTQCSPLFSSQSTSCDTSTTAARSLSFIVSPSLFLPHSLVASLNTLMPPPTLLSSPFPPISFPPHLLSPASPFRPWMPLKLFVSPFRSPSAPSATLRPRPSRSVHGRQKYPPPQIPPPIQHRHTLTTFEAPQKSFMGGSSTPSVHGRQQYPPPQIPPPCTFYSAQPLTCGSQQGTSRQCGATSPWLSRARAGSVVQPARGSGVRWCAVVCGGTQSCVVVVPVSACAVPQHIPSSVGLSAGHEQAVCSPTPSCPSSTHAHPSPSPPLTCAVQSSAATCPPHLPTSLPSLKSPPFLPQLAHAPPIPQGGGEESYGEDPLDIKTQEERRQGDDKRVKGEGQGEQEARKMGVRRDRMGVRRDRMDCGSKAGEVEGGFGEEEGSCGDGISPASQQVTGQPPQPSPLALVILPLPLPLLNSPCSLPLLAFPCLPSLPPSPSQYHRHHSRSQGRCPSRPLLPCSYCLWRWQTGVVLVV